MIGLFIHFLKIGIDDPFYNSKKPVGPQRIIP